MNLNESTSSENPNIMEKITSLCKRRGFIFQGSEIYGGLAGTYDYGPLGVALKNNIKASWWKKFVDNREDMYGVDAAILMRPEVWQASGHVAGFADSLASCPSCSKRFRFDNIIDIPDYNKFLSEITYEQFRSDGWEPDGDAESESAEAAFNRNLEEAKNYTGVISSYFLKKKNIKCPNCSKLDWHGGSVGKFNMLFQTQIGAMEDSSATVYLRPETAQGIFVNFKNIIDSFHPKLPFGIAQIGKAFRNEITPRDFIFRVREFEQMEIEYFVRPADWEKYFEYLKDEMLEWMESIGLDMTKVHELEVADGDRAHYSSRTIDFEFDYPFGKKELYGLAYRTDFDLKNHKLEYIDEEAGEKMTPHVIEPSFGVDRTMLALLQSAYAEDDKGDEVRTFLKFKPSIAPVICAVSPLLKNKPELVEYARTKVYAPLKQEFGRVMWDDNGNIGKRYRRQDEIGTPWCIVIDFDTLTDNTVTVRDRDTGAQERKTLPEVIAFIKSFIS